MRAFLLLALCAVVALLALTPVRRLRADQLLTNGGFEDGTTGWRVAGGRLDLVDAPVAEGDRAARFIVEGQWAAQAAHATSLERGATYRLSGRLLMDDPNSRSVELGLIWAAPLKGGRRETLIQQHSTEYQLISGPDVLIPCDASDFRVLINLRQWKREGSAHVYIDDLLIEAVGAPLPCPPPTPPPIVGSVPTHTPTHRPATAPRATATPRGAATPPGGRQSTELSPTSSSRLTPSHGLIVNGGFESARDGVPVGWETHGGVLGQALRPVHGGRFAGGFSSHSDSTKWVYQTVPVDPGGWYELEAYVYHDDPRVEAAFLRVSWYADPNGGGSALDQIDSTDRLEAPAPRYRRLTTGPVQAPPGARSARARVLLRPKSATSAVSYIDDVAFRATAPGPVPADEGDGASARASRSGRRAGGRSSRAQPGEPGGATSPHAVKINEVLYDGAASGDDSALEWVELYNVGDESVELEGWSLGDNKETDALSEGRLPAGGFAVVAASEELLGEFPEFDGELVVVDGGKLGNGLANRGDRLVLRDPNGGLADAISYGEDTAILDPPVPDVQPGHSLERRPAGHDTDTAADFIDNPQPSPGRGLDEHGILTARPTPVVVRSSALGSSGGGGLAWWPWALVVGVAVAGGGAGWWWRRRRVRRMAARA